MAKKIISDEIRDEILKIVETFNQKELADTESSYSVRFRGRYLYLDRSTFGRKEPICRLKYTGKIDNWEFAIFRWSSETYDSEDWLFPGFYLFDRTIESAMKVGMVAYPP